MLNKIDVAADPEAVDVLEATLRERGCTVYRISAVTRQGLTPLIYDCMGHLERLRAEEDARLALEPATVRYVATPAEDDRHWEARQVTANTYEVVGRGIERMVAMTDLTNEYALRRLQKSLDKIGITRKLKALGAKDGDTVKIRDVEFDYDDEDKWDEEDEAATQGKARRQ